jgi:hypothetical protein
MWDFIVQIKKHRGSAYFIIAACLLSFLSQAPAVQAMSGKTSCVTSITEHHQRPAAHSRCCCSNAGCGCQLKQGTRANGIESVIPPSSGISNPLNKGLIFDVEELTVTPARKQISGSNAAVMARGPTVKVYLTTLNLIC